MEHKVWNTEHKNTEHRARNMGYHDNLQEKIDSMPALFMSKIKNE